MSMLFEQSLLSGTALAGKTGDSCKQEHGDS